MHRMRRRRGGDSAAYEARTRDIVVRVFPAYAAEESSPEQGLYLWSYTVEIENHGDETVTLIARRWTITDAFNRVNEVEGSGVVGEQPLLSPGQTFEYTSGVPLNTPSGIMAGTYLMMSDAGQEFDG